MAIDWKTKRSIVTALDAKKPDVTALTESFDPEKKAHLATLQALEAEHLVVLASMKGLAHKLAYAGQQEVMEGRFEPALRIFDAITATKSNAALAPASGLGVALYAVQNDNHHLGLMPERAKRYLARALPHAAREGAISVNGACVAMELGEHELAIDLIGKARAESAEGWRELRKELLFAPLRKHPRFVAAFAPKPLPEIDEKRAAKKLKNAKAIESWRTWLKEQGKKYDASADTWPTKKSGSSKVDFWWKNRGGHGKLANAHFQAFAHTGDGSLVAVWAAEGKTFENGPVVLLGSEGDVYVLAENVPNALALFASIGRDGLDAAVEYGTDAEHDDAMTAWVAKTFGIVARGKTHRLVKAAGKAHGLSHVKKLVARIDAGKLPA